MRLIQLFMVLILGAITTFAQNTEILELQGDKLGEDHAAFAVKHPKAVCKNSTETRIECYQWADVAIFGMQAHPDADCSVKIHSDARCVQGLTAHFVNRKLISLSYAVPGTDKSVPTAELKKVFGTPMFDTREATFWSHGRQMANVIVGRATDSDHGPVLITIMIAQD